MEINRVSERLTFGIIKIITPYVEGDIDQIANPPQPPLSSAFGVEQ